MQISSVTYFRSPAELRKWFRANHATAAELWVGFYRKDSGKPSITWAQAVDEALCVGWIDGIRKRVDEDSYTNRFTPRRKRSVWSAINIARVQALSTEKRMRPEGLKAFAARLENRAGIYAYEQRRDRLEEPYASLLKKNKVAAAFFETLPPYYRKQIGWWIVSAKKEETRMERFKKFITAEFQVARSHTQKFAV